MICPYCGVALPPDCRFCGDCGQALAAPMAAPAPGWDAAPPTPGAYHDSLALTARRTVAVGLTAAAAAKPAVPPPAPASPTITAVERASASLRPSAFLVAVEAPAARLLRIALLLLLDAGLVGVGTYYLYNYFRLPRAEASSRMTIGQPALVRGQASGAPRPAAPAAPAPAPPAVAAPAAAGSPRARGARPAAPPPAAPAPAPAAAPRFAGARPAAPPPAPAGSPPRAPSPAAPAAERETAPAAAPVAPAAEPAASPPAEEPGEIEAQIDAESVRQVVTGHRGDVQACYSQALKTQPDLSGTVEVQFAINRQGRAVRGRVVRDTLGAPGVGDCIVGSLGKWRFPRPVGGEVEFLYPFTFSPGR